MNKKQLIRRYFSNPRYANFDDLRENTSDDGKYADIIFVYSGRNRGKSFEISAKAIMSAWYSNGSEQFGYVRRYDKEITIDKVVSYFADKIDFIKDLTDNKANNVCCKTGHIYLCNTHENEKGKIVTDIIMEIGRTFALNVSTGYKSMQFPSITELIVEEVLTQERALESEPQKLLNLISTVKRNKKDFHCWLIGNTISRINPYTTAFALKHMLRQKAGTLDTYKLYNGLIDENGNDEYYYILTYYMHDADNEKTDTKRKASSIVASSLNNNWEESRMYPIMSQKLINEYDSTYTAVIEYGDFCYLLEIKNVPHNLQEYYLQQIEKEVDIKLSDETMEVLFISKKTTAVQSNTRLFTTRPIVNPSTTIGLKITNELDDLLITLIDIGWCFYSDNLTANEFQKSLEEFKRF